jgi:hypothetical protein
LTDKEKPTATPRISRLDRVGGVITEMAKLYREARLGRLNVYDATRLASILTGLRGALETQGFEARLDALEAKLSGRERPGLKVVR